MLDSTASQEEITHTRGTPEFRQQMRDKRRLPEDKPRKSFEATQMWDVYQEIARRLVLGQKGVDVARDLGVTPVMVSYVRNSPIVRDKMNKLQEAADIETVSIAKRIKELAPVALDLLEDVIAEGKIGDEKLPTKLRAHHAEKLLDRAGYAPPKEVRALNLHAHYTPEEINKIKERATKGAKAQSIVVCGEGETDESK